MIRNNDNAESRRRFKLELALTVGEMMWIAEQCLNASLPDNPVGYVDSRFVTPGTPREDRISADLQDLGHHFQLMATRHLGIINDERSACHRFFPARRGQEVHTLLEKMNVYDWARAFKKENG